MRKPTARQVAKMITARTNDIFKVACDRVQIDIFDIGKVMAVTQVALLAGDDDATALEKTKAFVETIRKN